MLFDIEYKKVDDTENIQLENLCKKISGTLEIQYKNTHIGNIGNSVSKKSNASRKFRAENVSRIDPSCAAMPYLFILPHTRLQLQRQQEMPFMLRNCVIKRIGPYIKKPMCDFHHLLNTQTG